MLRERDGTAAVDTDGAPPSAEEAAIAEITRAAPGRLPGWPG
jgi:hypothetical protein